MSRRHHHEHGKHEIQGAHRQRAIYLHTLRMHYGGREQYVNDEENIETYKQFAAHLKRTILQTISQPDELYGYSRKKYQEQYVSCVEKRCHYSLFIALRI